MQLSRILFPSFIIFAVLGVTQEDLGAEQALHLSDQDTLVQGATAFAVDLYDELRREDGNIFISPISISTAFGLVQAGASGETAQEIAKVLYYVLPDERLHPALASLQTALQIDDEGRRVAINNKFWAQNSYPILSSYQDQIRTHYQSDVDLLDFKSDPESARQTINHWVEVKTEEKIVDLLGPEDITDITKTVLINTVYFKADWLSPFLKRDTSSDDFRLESGETLETSFMNKKSRFRYILKPDFDAVELLYKGMELSMVVFLPRQENGLSAFESRLRASHLQDWLDELEEAPYNDVVLSLPKVNIKAKYGLKKKLQNLGMVQSFLGGDFSRLVDQSGFRTEGYAIGQVVHQTFLEVDETGTEAAAATAVTGITVLSRRVGLPPLVFKADHPFFFVIRDNRTSSILFMGRIMDPSDERATG